MIVSINQPAYMPWLGYFDRIAASDVHVVLDHVQFEKNSFVNRNKIRTPDGWSWLTIPVNTKGKFNNLPIAQLTAADGGRWCRKHFTALRSNYARAPHFAEHVEFLDSFYQRTPSTTQFLPPVLELCAYFRSALGIATEIVCSSSLGVTASKSELVLELCRKLDASVYLSGALGRGYLQPDTFTDAGVEVLYHDYQPRDYVQVWPGFEPAMAVIDVLANNTTAAAADIMTSGRRLNSS